MDADYSELNTYKKCIENEPLLNPSIRNVNGVWCTLMGKKRALLIASYEFDYKGIDPLFAPRKDAEEMKSVLEDPAIGEFEVQMLPFDMDSSQVRKAINLFFVNSEPDDLLLLYYSGHGIKKDNKLYLLTKDTQPNTLKSSAVSISFSILSA